MSTTAHSTIFIERSFPKPPSAVFDCFRDPAKKRHWFAESEGFIVDAYELDFLVGGFERASFRFKPGAPLPEGTTCTNDTWYCDIVDDERIVIAYTMTINGERISASLATFEFTADGDGTKMAFTEQAAFFEGGDGPEMREQGWRALFERLVAELGG